MNPTARFYARELAGMVDEHYNAVWQELGNLEEIGLLLSEKDARARYCSLNQGFPIYPELKIIILKTAGLGDLLRQELQNLGSVEEAFICGSVVAGKEDAASDIDLMLIGEIDLLSLAPVTAGLEEPLGRSINYVVYSPEEFKERKDQRGPFLEDVLKGSVAMLIGREDGLSGIGAEGADWVLPSQAEAGTTAVIGRRAALKRCRRSYESQ